MHITNVSSNRNPDHVRLYTKQNCLSVKSFEALQILKSAYHNRHIAAVDDAAEHLVSIFDGLEADSLSDCPSLEV